MLRDGVTEKDALDAIGFNRYCCRRMFVTHVDLIDDLLIYHETYENNNSHVVTKKASEGTRTYLAR
jgi:DNA-directed RNA polymerase I, II, and III subunit RPABC5